jgi:hypothetical protein
VRRVLGCMVTCIKILTATCLVVELTSQCATLIGVAFVASDGYLACVNICSLSC